MADGTKYEIDIGVTGVDAMSAGASNADLLAAKLAESGLAATAASQAVKAAEASYRAAESAAAGAAKSLDRVTLSIKEQQEKLAAASDLGDAAGVERAQVALRVLAVRQADAASKAEAAATAVGHEATALEKLRAASDKASGSQDSLKKAHADAEKASKAQTAALPTGKVNEMAEAFGKLGGPVGTAGQKLFGTAEGAQKLIGSMGTLVGAVAGVVIVVAALVAGVVAATAALLKFAIANSDAARTSELLSAGIAKSVTGGAQLDDAIGSLAKNLPQSRDELQGMAADLAKTGLKGQALTNALEDAAVKAAELKWGPDWAKQTKSLDKQAQVFKGHLGEIFRLNIEPLLDGLSQIVALFDSSSVTGQAIKVVFQDVFQTIIEKVAELVPKFIKAFIQIEIAVLKALIAIKPYGSTIVGVFEVIAIAVAVVVGVVVGALALAVAAIVAVIAAAKWMSDTFYGVGQSIRQFGVAVGQELGAAFDWLTEKFNAVVAFLSGLSLSEIGTQLIQGLANGIMGGGAAVLSAITGVVDGAIGAAKSALGIASPSKVFEEIGDNTTQGMAGGVEGGTAAVQGSLESMVAAPAEAGGGIAGEGGGGAGRGGDVTVNITVNAAGGDGPSIASATRDAIRDYFNGLKIQGGGEVPA